MTNFLSKQLTLIFLFSTILANANELPKCLFISSYHVGYKWSDSVEEGLRDTLKGKCQIKQFDMDTKRIKTKEFKESQALKAKKIIEEYKPDVVITADDNAAKYIIKKYYKDHTIPFVFCGVNWTVKEYGFPYSNVTGMVEVAPIFDILRNGMKFSKGKKALYIGANTLTEQKNYKRYQKAAKKFDISIDKVYAEYQTDWQKAYQDAQNNYDFIILGSNSGINDWKENEMIEFVKNNTKKLSLSVHGWMMPYGILGLTKIPQEQGIWSAKCALDIINGTKPNEIPIVTNRQWDIWINYKNLNTTQIKLSQSLLKKAKKF